MVDIIDEIKEDLAHERIAKLWSTYGSWVIGAALLVIAGTAGGVWWNGHVAQKQEEISERYYHAVELLQQDKKDEAKAVLDSIKQSDSKAYPALAGFTEASNLQMEKKNSEAIVVLQSVADNNKVDAALRDLALLHIVNLEITHQLADEKTISQQLEQLTKPGSVWRFSALELQANYALGKGNKEKALEIFGQINEDPEAPGNIQSRAAEMVRALSDGK